MQEITTEFIIPFGALTEGFLVSSPIYPAESYPEIQYRLIIIPTFET
jgi:hypothetical protein